MAQQRITELARWYNRSLPLTIACGVGLLFGLASLWLSPAWVLVGLAASCLLVVMVMRPELGLLAIVTMTSSVIFEERLPVIPIGIGSLNVPDIPLLMLIGLIIVRYLAKPEFKLVHTPLDLPLLIFLGMILLSTLIAMGRGSVSTVQALRGIRPVSYYLTFFVITNLVRRKAQLSLLMDGLILLASIVAGVMIAQSLLGGSVTLFPGRVETLVTQGSAYAGVTRVLPPGQSLVMFGFVLLVVLTAIGDAGSLFLIRLFQVGLLGLAVLLTFNRNFWVIAGLAVALLVGLSRVQDRQKLLARGLLALILGAMALGLAFTQAEPRVDRLVHASLARMATLVSGSTLQEDSLQYRLVENTYALPLIASHPIIGLGLRDALPAMDPATRWD